MIVERVALALVGGSARRRISTAFTLKKSVKIMSGDFMVHAPISVPGHFGDDGRHLVRVVWNLVDRQFLVLCADK
jgi:hypothetical protein